MIGGTFTLSPPKFNATNLAAGVSGTCAFTATTTNPTKGTVTTDTVVYWRVGPNMVCQINYNQSSGGSSGSGDYILAVPGGLTIASGITTNSTVYGNANQVGANCFGTFFLTAGGSSRNAGAIYARTTTTLSFWIPGSQVWNSGGAGFAGATSLSGFFIVPISGWNAYGA